MILAIESSCDETSVALVAEGPQVVAELMATQVALHDTWGGVVPELASRAHQEVLAPLVTQVLKKGQVTLDDVEAIAVAHCPGLMGPLLVGLTFAKSLSMATGKPLIGINHLEGHMASVMLENKTVPLGALGLLVSGGHTLLLKKDEEGWALLGGTRDDAAGEAFDKGARLLDLPYPGGVHLSRLAETGKASAIKFPRSSLDDGSVSFSGLKSDLRRRLDAGLLQNVSREDVAASYQEAIVDTLTTMVEQALVQHPGSCLVVTGGVSCNTRLRERLSQLAGERNMEVMLPEPRWGTDNAAMIGATAWPLFKAGRFSPLSLEAQPRVAPRRLLEQKRL